MQVQKASKRQASRVIEVLARQVRERIHAGERAARSVRRLQTFIEEAPVPLAMFDGDMRYLASSARWNEAYGLVGQSIVGRSHYEIFPDIPPRWKEVHQRALGGEVVRSDEDLFLRDGGEELWLRWEVKPWHTEDGKVGGIMIFSEDISARKRAERDLRIAATVFESQQGVFVTDAKTRILRVNRVFEEITGYSAQEIVGQTPAILKSDRHGKQFFEQLWTTLQATRTWRGEIWNRRKTGEVYPEDLSIAAVMDERGDVANYVGTFDDLSGTKRAEEVIRHLSFYDPLTGLPNRRLLLEELSRELQAGDRENAVYGAILKIDLDSFSLLNDTSSRRAGDIALVEVGTRVRACVPEGSMVVRLANDEFAVLLKDLGAHEQQAALQVRNHARTLMGCIKQPVQFESETRICTACVGARLFLASETNAETLLRQAHAALHQAKHLGPDSFEFYSPRLQAALERRVHIESLLRKAQPKEMVLHYQPQVDRSGDLLGVEALVRWRASGGVLIPPSEFVHVAEESGFILQLGRWILQAACRQIKEWETSAELKNLRVAVNVSAKQLAQPGFVEEVLDAVRAGGADPHHLELELTESMLIGNSGEATEKMRELKAWGIHFSLDDFGTGYSSLAYLRRMPLDKLKIDQSFVADVHRNTGDAAIARTIIALGRSLGLTTIAEGVEEHDQFSFLANEGCSSYQGFLFGRPAEPEQLSRISRATAPTVH
jgi:diguanylate cyclase (GGDEF)-like protein/PAS domain S-box-containing protein